MDQVQPVPCYPNRRLVVVGHQDNCFAENSQETHRHQHGFVWTLRETGSERLSEHSWILVQKKLWRYGMSLIDVCLKRVQVRCITTAQLDGPAYNTHHHN